MNCITLLKKISARNRLMENVVFVGYLCYSGIVYLISTAMRVCPVDETKIVFSNMKGKRYGDNPMYILEILQKKRPEYKYVWLLNRGVKVELPDGVCKKGEGLFSKLYELSTAKVWVDSNTKEYGTYKRREQFFVQTWHGSYGLKKNGFNMGDRLSKIDQILYPYNSSIQDLGIANSDRQEALYRSEYRYYGKMLKCGSPRNDVFLREDNSDIIKKVHAHFGIKGKRVILYAPTFRQNRSMHFLRMDFRRVLSEMKKATGDEWVTLVRFHPQNIDDAKKIIYTDRIINATNYSIMQELLVAADVLITDYSSCMFDFITVPKPCFIFAPDLEEYERDRGNYYRMEELPFPLARNNEELAENIMSFDMEEYTKKVYDLHERVGLCETGHASEAVADCIIDFIENGNR